MNYQRLIIILALLFCFTVNPVVLAVEVKNLYTGKILVNDKTQKTRVKAHRWAIEQVLSKVSGDKNILENDIIKRAVQYSSANYIKSFAFKTDDQNRTFLVDEFDQTKIDKLIKSVGGSIWGLRRPNTLIWLAIEEGMYRSIIEEENYPQLSEILTQSADDRGLPIIMPLMDAVDQENVFTSDVWARFDQTVSAGSERYNVDNYIMARMRYVDANKEPDYQTGWLLQFQLMKNNKRLLSGEFSGEQFFVIREMINQVGDYFAAEYAIDSEQVGADNLELVLNDLPNIVSLNKAEKYLSSLPPVTKVQLLRVNKRQARFYLDLSGEGLDVVRALALLPEFEKITQTVQKKPLKSLSIEQQLEILTRDYNEQARKTDDSLAPNPENNDSLASKPETQSIKKPVILSYKWLGN